MLCRAFVLAALAAAAAAAATGGARAQAWTGVMKAFDEPTQHLVAGVVKITSDTTFIIEQWAFDGVAPDAYVYISDGSTTSGAGIKASGTRISAKLGSGDATGQKAAQGPFTLPDGKTFDQFADASGKVTVSVLCFRYSALFAKTVLAKGATPPACPRGKTNCLANCRRLDKYFYLWWEVDATSQKVTFEHEAAIGVDEWAGFGPAKPGAWGMVESDPVITGVYGGQAVALDYYLTARSQCNYNGAADSGVCPDAGVTCGSAKGVNNVEAVSGAHANGVLTVRYTRPLASGDGCDHDMSASAAFGAVWGTGPFTAGTSQGVVNKHGTGHMAGRGGPAPANFQFDLSATGNTDCMMAPKKDPPPTTGAMCAPLLLLKEKTTFDVTTANYVEHPNGSGWGITYFIDGEQSPELVLERGTEYTFRVMATDQHPLYITNDAIGGRRAAAVETVYGGSATAHGTASAPFELKWTPTAETPDTVYYQCWLHEKLGWRIYVVDAGASAAFTPPASSRTTACHCARTCAEETGLQLPSTGAGGAGAPSGNTGGGGGVPSTLTFAGKTGALSTLQHLVRGDIRIVSDTKIEITNFHYDGKGPDVYVYAAAAGTPLHDGVRVGDELAMTAYTGSTLTVDLPAGTSLPKIAAAGGTKTVVISIYCRAFKANFGQAEITGTGDLGSDITLGSGATAVAAAAPAAAAAALVVAVAAAAVY